MFTNKFIISINFKVQFNFKGKMKPVSALRMVSARSRILQQNVRLKSSAVEDFSAVHDEYLSAKPYSEVPGPSPLPLLGNTWRFIPLIGKPRLITMP